MPILIIGASFSGLCLATKLASRSVPFILFEAKEYGEIQRHRFHFHEWAYLPLLKTLSTSGSEQELVPSFQKQVAIDAAMVRRGSPDTVELSEGDAFVRKVGEKTGFRANRGILTNLLREGGWRNDSKLRSRPLDIKYGHRLASVETGDNEVTACFENGEKVKGSMLVAADGVHSRVRSQLLPELPFEILDFAVYYGQQHLTPAQFKRYADILKGATKLSASQDGAALAISINERQESVVKVGYTYSRRASQDDPLLQPGRAKDKAHDIPPQLFDELANLGAKLPEPFRGLCDKSRMDREGDRMVHWLMRSLSIPLDQLEELAHKRIALIGDAAHPMPLLTADGANHAILDGLELGDKLSAQPAIEELRDFSRAAHERWREGSEEAKSRLEQMHPSSSSKL